MIESLPKIILVNPIDLIIFPILFPNKPARLATKTHCPEDLVLMNHTLQQSQMKPTKYNEAVGKTLLCSLKDAEAHPSTGLILAVSKLNPDIIHNFVKFRACEENDNKNTHESYRMIHNKTIDQNTTAAARAKVLYFQDIRHLN